MKRLAAVIGVVTTLLIAEPVKADGYGCASKLEVLALIKKYKEELVIAGMLGDAPMTLYGNEKTGTWSFVVELPTQTCVTMGRGFKRAPVGMPI